MNTEKINRLELIDYRQEPGLPGCWYVVLNAKVQIALQNFGETLKVFISDRAE